MTTEIVNYAIIITVIVGNVFFYVVEKYQESRKRKKQVARVSIRTQALRGRRALRDQMAIMTAQQPLTELKPLVKTKANWLVEGF